MRVLPRIIFALLAIVIVVPIVVIGTAWVGLNTESGRNFAIGEINHFAGPSLQVAGLHGHFPADLALDHLALGDADGAYATADDVQLRWQPLQLLSRHLDMSLLQAANITILRAPVPANTTKSSSASGGLPNLHVDIDQLAIGALHIAPDLSGQDITLAITGAAHLADLNFQNPRRDQVSLNADAAGKGTYHVTATVWNDEINAQVSAVEPPDGLLGHLAGPQFHAPLNIDLSLAGPRKAVSMKYAASLGAAAVNGAGMLALDPNASQADLVVNIPALAPVAALAGQNIAGDTTLHLITKHTAATTDLALDGQINLTAGPGPSARLVGNKGKFSARVNLTGGTVNIKTLNIEGAGFKLAAVGSVAPSAIHLDTDIALNNVGMLSPGISGPVDEDGVIQGSAKDFSIAARLSGDIADRSIPSGPFAIAINAAHLPSAPTGTLTGSGALEGAPLLLDTQFTRNALGATHVLINTANWKSLKAQADISLAPGETLPTGTAKFAVGSLADFAALVPLKLTGSVDGDFAHTAAQKITLNLRAHNVLAVPSVGAVNATLSATGPINALAVKLAGTIAKIVNAPARIALTGVLNVNTRAATISAFTAAWRNVNVNLQGPAGIDTQPGITVQHLALALNGGSIALDGALTPKLNLTAAAKNLPLSLASLAAPSLQASGMIGLSATITGSPSAPAGKVTFNAQNIRVHQGPGAALPPADLTATIALAGSSANLDAKLGLGPNATLAAAGLVPLNQTGPINLHVTGRTDLRLIDPILAAQGSTLRGLITPDITVTGTPASPRADGTVTLAGGALQNIGSGLNLTAMSASVVASSRLVTVQKFQAGAGEGNITGHGTLDLGTPNIPIDLTINAANATPVSSDLATESFNAALTIKGFVRGAMALAGNIDLLRANINIPKSLPPSVANLTILNEGEPRPPPPPPAPPISLNLTVDAKRQIFIRGDGLFAELGGKVHLTGTAADPDPQGGFTLIRGNFALAGRTLQFTKGTVDFTGDGFMPTLDLEATSTTANNTTASLIVGGTAAKPTITLTATPPLPSDEVLSQLLFGQSTSSLSPFQAASLAAALASLSGVGGSLVSDPLGGVRNALGLDELSLGGSGSGAPTVNAGRYVAPGVYVGAQQSTGGQGTQATVQINLYKGLQLQTATGTSGAGGGASSSVGLTYQFNY
jgi:translocation and assembly module TamB